ncbi:hypothetical protein SLE2022_205750 [Rubroshorea leprosula]
MAKRGRSKKGGSGAKSKKGDLVVQEVGKQVQLTSRELDLQGIGLSSDEVPEIEPQSCEVDTENVIGEEILSNKLGSSSLVANMGPATGHGVGER